MKTLFSLMFLIIFTICFNPAAFSQDQNTKAADQSDLAPTNPLYQLRVANVTYGANSSTQTNTISFDIYIYHTNLANSGPFEFAAGQYYLKFDPSIANGGSLTYSIVPNSTEFTNPDAIPINPNIVGGQLRLERNIPLVPGQGPIVSSVFPGTRIVSLLLSTTAPVIDLQRLDLSWIKTNVQNSATEVYAFGDSGIVNISDSGNYIIDSTDVPLPVELTGFASSISRNNVNLYWSTSSESNNSGFEIERNEGNLQWVKVGFVRGNGTTSASNNYSFEDKNLSSGLYNYRLKQVDYNGNFEYFNLNNEINIGAPDKFSLKQNYPNPFNPTTRIDFDIPVNEFTSLKLYDNNGREVKSLINEFKTAGYYSVELNASSLASGAYYYILNSGNFHSTKKLILLK
ncbi:MAG TPA: T9SS type A sorting domain-containing protein [Ignavibacteria bacterium]|nr:T9SS type A sorting domain-containing protein [Ignavibacteria bacterium]